MRLSPIIFTGLALLITSCQQMKFPWNQAGAGTYDATGASSTAWGQQPTGTQWGQGTSTSYPAQTQGWQQQSQPSQGAWGGQQQSPPQQQQGWGSQNSNGGNSNLANDGGWNNSGGNNNSQGASNNNDNSGGWNGGNSAGSAAASSSGRTHTIARGDTLTNISKRYGTTVRRIMQANSMSDPNRIQLGQRLAIP
jgi:LysM repeat protein